ncbi:MAG: hypothetical protein ACOYK9_04235, partial [Chlamydiia bacterium]
FAKQVPLKAFLPEIHTMHNLLAGGVGPPFTLAPQMRSDSTLPNKCLLRLFCQRFTQCTIF